MTFKKKIINTFLENYEKVMRKFRNFLGFVD
jgi:hypothetical protein